jgi:tight adherence protein C
MLAAMTIDVPLLVTATAGFFAMGSIVWLLFSVSSAEKPRAEKRLAEINRSKRKESSDSGLEEKRGDALKAVLNRAEAFSKPMQLTNEQEISQLRGKLVAAGFRGHSAMSVFLGLKVICILLGIVIGGGVSLFMYGVSGAAMVRLGVIVGIAMFIPDMVLKFIMGRRQEQIFLGLPDALDLMVVCVEAGLGLDQALRKVTIEMKKSYRVIADEFGLTNMHSQMGRTRSEALQDLGARTGVDDLRQLCGILIQADRFGTGIANALRVQSDAMRTKRRQLAEEKAAKTAVKLIFPLVIFIFPGIFVVLVGPAAIQMIDKMLK